MDATRSCSFAFAVPRGYWWLLQRGLVGYDQFTALQPWHYLDRVSAFSVSERWPSVSGGSDLFAFARRQDCDDLACFKVEAGSVAGIVIVHGWTAVGYEVVIEYQNFWEWLKSVVDDIAEWSALGD
jgi:hypothetical protein